MPDLRLTLSATRLDFDPFADNPASYKTGFRGHFPAEPGRAEERVDVRVEPIGAVIRLGEARPRCYLVDLRALAAAVRDAETPDHAAALHA
jgi:hypothetical protein